MKKFFVLAFILVFGRISAQTITYDEFLKITEKSLNTQAVKELRDFFPDDFLITGMDTGDFSGDNKNDLAIAVKPTHKRSHDIYVFLFCDSLGHYVPVYRDTLKYFELTIEVGFSINKGVCFITQKLDEDSWQITGYTFTGNQLALYDKYKTKTKNLTRRRQIGEEDYFNYKSEPSFLGYYDVDNLSEFKKAKFFYHPVYDRKRNIYKDYTKKINIDGKWLWNESAKFDFGIISFTKEKNELIADIKIFGQQIVNLSKSERPVIRFYFDRQPKMLLENQSKNKPKFRDKTDSEIGWISLELNPAEPQKSEIQYEFGDNYGRVEKGDIKFNYIPMQDPVYELTIPMSVFKLLDKQREMGIFISINLATKENSHLVLRNSDGSFDDPSSYGRMIFLGENEYFGSIKNDKFAKLIEEAKNNGIFK